MYTSALLEQMQQTGLKVEDVFKNTRAEVLDRSQGQQTPWESSSLVGDFYFHSVEVQVDQPELNTSIEVQKESPSSQEIMQARNEIANRNPNIPDEAVRKAGNRSGNKIPFKWRANAAGTYYLMVEDREISKETISKLRGEHMYVYHKRTNRVFILKWYIHRRDGLWHRGITYE